MSPDATPERDSAAQEARLAAEVRGDVPPYWRLTWGDIAAIVIGLALAVGLYVLHLGGN